MVEFFISENFCPELFLKENDVSIAFKHIDNITMPHSIFSKKIRALRLILSVETGTSGDDDSKMTRYLGLVLKLPEPTGGSEQELLTSVKSFDLEDVKSILKIAAEQELKLPADFEYKNLAGQYLEDYKLYLETHYDRKFEPKHKVDAMKDKMGVGRIADVVNFRLSRDEDKRQERLRKMIERSGEVRQRFEEAMELNRRIVSQNERVERMRKIQKKEYERQKAEQERARKELQNELELAGKNKDEVEFKREANGQIEENLNNNNGLLKQKTTENKHEKTEKSVREIKMEKDVDEIISTASTEQSKVQSAGYDLNEKLNEQIKEQPKYVENVDFKNKMMSEKSIRSEGRLFEKNEKPEFKKYENISEKRPKKKLDNLDPKINILKKNKNKETKILKSNLSTAHGKTNKIMNRYKRPQILHSYKPRNPIQYKTPEKGQNNVNWSLLLDKCEIDVFKLKLLCDTIGVYATGSYLSKQLSNCFHARYFMKNRALTQNFVELTRKILKMNGISIGMNSGKSRLLPVPNSAPSSYYTPRASPLYLSGK